jgi:hypothetical protein
MSADAPSSWGDSNLTTIIAGCVASFIVTISITIATICIRLRRRSQALPAVSAGVGASQPHVDEIPRPLPDDASSSLPGRPMTVRPHVRVVVLCVALVWPQISSYSRMLRTRRTQLLSRGAKVIRTRNILKPLSHCTSQVEVPWSTPRPRCPKPRDITAYPLSDLALRSHAGVGLIAFLVLFVPSSKILFVPSSKSPVFLLRL